MSSDQAQETPQSDPIGSETTDSGVARFAADVAGVLVSPSETLRDIGERGAVIPALILVMLIVVLSTGVSAMMLMLQASPFVGPVSPTPAFMLGFQLINLVWNLVWAPVLWTIVAGLLFGLAWLLGGRGRFQALWAASGFALLPQLLTVPILAGHELVGAISGSLQLLSLLVLIPVSLGALAWNLVLLVIAIRETMSLTTGRSVGVLGLFFGVLVMIGVIIACIWIFLILVLIGILSA